MVLQDKYKRANSSRYRATHGGIQSNRQKARNQEHSNQTNEFPELSSNATASTEKENQTTDTTTSQNLPGEETTHKTFARRQLASNLDRYLEPEPDPNQESEPEIDLTNFIEKQRNQLQNGGANNSQGTTEQEDEDIDQSFNHLFKHSKNQPNLLSNTLKKPTKILFQDPNELGLDELDNERKKADAARELIARFSGQTKLSNATSKTQSNLKKLYRQTRFNNASSKKSSSSTTSNQTSDECNSASAAPTDLVGPLDDEAFLDEVLNDSSGTYGKFKRT